MDSKPKYAMQSGGMCHLWQSSDGSFKHSFLKLDFDCEADRHAGVLIVANEHYESAFAATVQNLQKELPAILQRIPGKVVAYWWLEDDPMERARIMSGLTCHPVFADRRW